MLFISISKFHIQCFFLLEYTGELHIFVLREREREREKRFHTTSPPHVEHNP
uniref:Uncharacterized protein n=1 Tax=Arundo donax TaxID=35708 RepID=A0A0A9H845_ARUDO